MRIDAAGALADATAGYKAERSVLHLVAGLFFFVPALALLFFVERQAADGATTEALTVVLQRMLVANWPWLLGAQLIELFGSALLFAWMLSAGRLTLGQALRRATVAFVPFFAASLIVGILTFAGMMLFLAPGFYVIGRTFLVAPIMLAEPATSPMKAFERSLLLTRGNGWLLFVVAAAIWLTGQLPNLLLRPLEAGLGEPGAALVNIVSALASAAVTLALILVKIAVYRRAAVPKQGM